MAFLDYSGLSHFLDKLKTLFVPLSQKGANSGVATLDANGKIPANQLPSVANDIIEGYYYNDAFYEEAAHTTLITGETGKIYVAADTNKTYRWSGTAYVEISASLALGETSSTAYRGDYGKTAYDHASAKGSAFSSGFYKITTNAQGHVTAATAVAKSDITGLGIPGQDTTYSAATTSAAGLMSADDKTKLNGIATGATANVVSNSLSDTSTTNALSAAKGKALNDSVTSCSQAIGNLSNLTTTEKGSLVGAANELNNKMLTITTHTLVPNKGQIVSGGYFQLGNLVIVQVVINTTESTSTFASGLPHPRGNTYWQLLGGSFNEKIFVSPFGQIVSDVTVAAATRQIVGVYMCE